MAAKQPRPIIGINADFCPANKSLPQMHRLNLGYTDVIYNTGGNNSVPSGLPLKVPWPRSTNPASVPVVPPVPGATSTRPGPCPLVGRDAAKPMHVPGSPGAHLKARHSEWTQDRATASSQRPTTP